MKRLPFPSLCRREGGFALLITITLLAFLVLLLVALSSLTRVETQVVSNVQQITQARQNALMALNIALGELQLQAGPDQRVTAQAQILNSSNSALSIAPDATPSALQSFWSTGSPYWTGVWKNPDSPTFIYTKTPVPVLEGWLVGGNEGIAPGGTPAFSPTDQIGNLTAASTASSTNLTIAGKPAVLLVGSDSTNEVGSYVVAPRVDIAATVPGMGGTPVIGRYAWWIGDEGVKANYGLQAPPNPTSAQTLYGEQVASRNGIERMAGMASYPINNSILSNVLALPQIQMADTNVTSAVLGGHFHELTPFSWGVLANTQAGGLRGDLSYYMENGGLTGSILPTTDASGNAIFSGSASLSQGAPTWQLLRSFYKLADSISGGSLPSTPMTTTVHGVFPIIVQARMFYTLYVDAAGQCYIRLYPAFVVANPYSVTLTGGVDFLYFESSYTDGSRAIELQTGSASDPVIFNLQLIQPSGTASLLGPITFHLPSLTLAPGQAEVVSLANAATDIAFGPSAQTATMRAGTINPNYYIQVQLPGSVLPATALSPITANWNFSFPGGGILNMRLYQEGTTNSLQTILAAAFSGTLANITVPAPTSFGVEIPINGYSYHIYTPEDNVVRPYADYNIRAAYLRRPAAQNAPGTFYGNPIFSGGEITTQEAFTQDITPSPYWGRSTFSASGNITNMVLFDIPERPSAGGPAMLSIGAFQHASLTADSAVFSSSNQPGYLVGNSLANAYVDRADSSETRKVGSGSSETYYDMSYLLNTALWDGYFFSGLSSWTSAILPSPMPNPHMVSIAGAPEPNTWTGTTASSYLMLNGAFNVNSVSVQAWAALLSGLRDQANSRSAIRRGLYQPGGATDIDTSGLAGTTSTAYNGFRDLSDDTIYTPGATPDTDTGLAVNLVQEIRRRGPFVSLAQFINRELTPGPASDTGPETAATLLGLKGALQTAIDNSGINSGFPSTENHSATGASELASYADPQATDGVTGTAIPGWLTQADVLQVIGPELSARSDTFRIRAYGEVINPVTQATEGRAWCEAIVQRMPAYVKPSSGAVGDAPSVQSPVDPENQTFGRRFQIISFRWLGPADI